MTTVRFDDALVFDGHGPELRRASVYVEDGLIRAVTDGRDATPADIVVDVGGRTLMPGLIDAHVHAWIADVNIVRTVRRKTEYLASHLGFSLRGMLDRGFTTVRDAGGTDPIYVQAIEDGLLAAPRLLASGRIISQTGGHGDFRDAGDEEIACGCCAGRTSWGRFAAVVDSVDEARRAVREEFRKGAAQIKLMGSGGVSSVSDALDQLPFTDDEIRAVVEEAERHGSYVMAHCHPAEAIRRMVELGVRSVEHGTLIDEETARFVAERGAFVVPTLATIHMLKLDGRNQGFPEISLQKLEAVIGPAQQSLEILKRAGVRTGFGTDLLGPHQKFQGIEFALRGEVLPALDVLRSATSVNAEILRLDGKAGVIAPSAYADLIVVDGDPLADLSLLARGGENLAVIMKGGRFHKRLI